MLVLENSYGQLVWGIIGQKVRDGRWIHSTCCFILFVENKDMSLLQRLGGVLHMQDSGKTPVLFEVLAHELLASPACRTLRGIPICHMPYHIQSIQIRYEAREGIVYPCSVIESRLRFNPLCAFPPFTTGRPKNQWSKSTRSSDIRLIGSNSSLRNKHYDQAVGCNSGLNVRSQGSNVHIYRI